MFKQLKLVLGLASLLLTTRDLASQQLLLDELHRMLPAEARETGHVLGDLDGDGDPDLLLVHREKGVEVTLNDGKGAFGETLALDIDLTLTNGSPPTIGPVLLADLDGDGDLDSFVGMGDTDPAFPTTIVVGAQNLLFQNDGTAGFSDATAGRLPAILDQTLSAASADVDGDGDRDLLVGNEPHFFPFLPDHALYLNDGSGVFADAPGLPASSVTTSGIRVSDVDGDDDVDLLLFTTENRLLINAGLGSFTDETFRLGALPTFQPLALGDLDGDFDPDALSYSTFLVNDGAGFFAVGTGGLPTEAPNTTPVLADVNGDGHLDVLQADSFVPSPRLFLGDGTGSLVETAVPGKIGNTGLVVGDIDVDGDQDVVLSSRSQGELLLGDGTGAFFASASVFESALELPGGNSVLLHDLDLDGRLDLFLTSARGVSSLLFGDGRGDFTDATASLSVTSGSFRDAGAADADGDGDPDLLVGSESGANRLLLNDGVGVFSEVANAFPEPASCGALAVADFNADGSVDVLFGQNFTNPSRLYLNDGTGVFTVAPSSLPFSGLVEDVVAVDFNGNGSPDVVAFTSSSSFRLLNDGSATFTSTPLASPLGTCVTAADADGDGDIDLGVGTDEGDKNEYWRNNGAGGFSRVLLPGEKRNASGVAFLDVDGNGRPDLLFTNSENPGNSAPQLLLNGLSGFTEASSQLGSKPDELGWDIAVGDIDGDGDDDAVVAGGRAILPYTQPLGVTRVFSNLYRHLAWRSVPRIGKQLVLDQHGTPGGPFWLLAALAPGELELPPLGTLRVDPATFVIFASGFLDAEGRSTFALPIPRLPGLVGLSLYFQSALGQPILLTNLERVTFTAF